MTEPYEIKNSLVIDMGDGFVDIYFKNNENYKYKLDWNILSNDKTFRLWYTKNGKTRKFDYGLINEFDGVDVETAISTTIGDLLYGMRKSSLVNTEPYFE